MGVRPKDIAFNESSHSKGCTRRVCDGKQRFTVRFGWGRIMKLMPNGLTKARPERRAFRKVRWRYPRCSLRLAKLVSSCSGFAIGNDWPSASLRIFRASCNHRTPHRLGCLLQRLCEVHPERFQRYSTAREVRISAWQKNEIGICPRSLVLER